MGESRGNQTLVLSLSGKAVGVRLQWQFSVITKEAAEARGPLAVLGPGATCGERSCSFFDPTPCGGKLHGFLACV